MKVSFSIINILKQGGVGVLPTDTLYGLVGSAREPQAVERIYALRHRQPSKPLIILISSLNDLKTFGIKLTPSTCSLLTDLWPGPVSIILPLAGSPARLKKLAYLHRGKKSLAFRLPKPKWLRDLLKKTGPLVAPSSNLAGEPPATTIGEAKKYFGKQVDFYLASGNLSGPASKLVNLTNNKIKVIRA